jgi:hypothetical protein
MKEIDEGTRAIRLQTNSDIFWNNVIIYLMDIRLILLQMFQRLSFLIIFVNFRNIRISLYKINFFHPY